MSSFPLVTHAQAQDILAYRQDGPITAAQFLADARHLAADLPAGRHVLNVCVDRYRFAVGVAAALLADKISLLPPTLTPEMMRQVKHFAPDVFCLVDQPQAIDLPQFAWAGALAVEASATAAPASATYDVPDIAAERTAAIVFTSGSTGTPVPHPKSWGALVRSVRAEAARLGLLDGSRHSIVATVPPQHMFGFEASVLLALQSGSALSAAHPFYPADICALLAAAPRPCLLVSTPLHLKVLLASGLDIPTVDLVLSATAPMTPQLALAVEAGLQAPLFEIYGSTETGLIASRRTTASVEWTLFPGVRLSVSQGRTWVSGGHVDPPMPLADELELLSGGGFLLHGRSADLVNIAGKRSSLDYLNHQLNAIPGVIDGAFFMPDEPDDTNVTRLMAFAVAPGLSVGALLVALRERIDAVFIPRPLVLLASLPRNSSGKLPRDALQALASQHQRQGTPHAA
ncbi:MAG: AMP-binding protein [Gammaproteobacteria bacterium]|nr:AMP-binding protein [Gammaproteobacteria bacterium]MBU3996179.1 AMP-binding protein [Gammaproteobacteria bacterium]MBU4081531.1 AMP-binding protein [Gammaproteobacteria bacterium]MBU4114910.1 AMP-binding protein [Gammaproteobacteria bacterium]MBU4170171.1 AMP-binding protein [Gammaproteobacteria bacterium]